MNDTANGVHFAAFDGNGNVAGLVKATDGTTSAVYEYGPFGELLRATGPMSKANPLRFSTKYQDDETDLLYYGYRYYNASVGRWIGRDPLGEGAGANLYEYTHNNALSNTDPDGGLTLDGTEQTTPDFKCGQYRETWDIGLQAQTPKSGYIVQEVFYFEKWTKCGHLWDSTYSYSQHFWEIGHVSLGAPVNGVIPAGSPAGTGLSDLWLNSVPHDGTIGEIEVTGIARFYYTKTTGILNWGRVPNDVGSNFTSAGTTAEPPFWNQPPDNGEAEVSHTTTVLWSCCCPRKWNVVNSDHPVSRPSY